MARHFQRNLPVKVWEEIPDERSRQGRRHALGAILQLMTLGMAVAAPTLRDVEQLAQDVSHKKKFGLKGRISDTTMYRIAQQVPCEGLLAVIQEQVRGMHRAKQLQSEPGVSLSLVAIDGKTIATDEVRKHPEQQDQSQEGHPCYTLRVLRAVHVSSTVKPIIGQHVLPHDMGESNSFLPFMDQLIAAYGKTALLECISVDAGFTSRASMEALVRDYGVDYIAALKLGQPTLYAEAVRLLGEGDAVPPEGWERVQTTRDGPRTVTRMIARTTAMAEFHGWTTLRQVWRVRQVTHQGGRVRAEERYFLTSLRPERLTATACMRAVRAHWGIENESNWTMDVMWKEDSRAWVRTGTALEALSLLRIVAFNLIRLLRCRVLRSQDAREMSYRRLFGLVWLALVGVHHGQAYGFT